MRYAIYLTPPADAPLADAAEQWLGRSAFSGAQHPAAAPACAKVHQPAHYGFHATMRAPFRLAEGVSEGDLVARFRSFAETAEAPAPILGVQTLGFFVALTARDNAPLMAAAETVLRAFDPLRAPLSEAEREKRKPDKLDDRGRELLDTWGYPHVMERFLFHMTLSGSVGPDAPKVHRAAELFFADHVAKPQRLVYALFREDDGTLPFRIIDVGP